MEMSSMEKDQHFLGDLLPPSHSFQKLHKYNAMKEIAD